MKTRVKLLGLIPIEIEVAVEITDDIPQEFAGRCVGWRRVQIRSDYRNDAGLLAHEQRHVWQWWLNPLHPLLMKFSRSYRLWSEVDAYRVQARCYPDEQQPAKLAKFAEFIATRYGLDTSAAEVLRRLNED